MGEWGNGWGQTQCPLASKEAARRWPGRVLPRLAGPGLAGPALLLLLLFRPRQLADSPSPRPRRPSPTASPTRGETGTPPCTAKRRSALNQSPKAKETKPTQRSGTGMEQSCAVNNSRSGKPLSACTCISRPVPRRFGPASTPACSPATPTCLDRPLAHTRRLFTSQTPVVRGISRH